MPRLKGAINKIIDEALHPSAEKQRAFAVLDGALHYVNEVVIHGDRSEKSLVKFIKYNSKFFIKKTKYKKKEKP